MMTRNPSRRRSLVKYTFAAPLFLILVILLASPDNPVMAETAHVGNKIETSILKLEKPNTATKQKIDGKNTLKSDNIKIAVLFANKKGGVIAPEDFKKFDAINIVDELTGKELACKKVSYALVHIPREADPRQANVQAKTNDDVKRLIGDVQNGDQYSFMNIKIQLDGDKELRDMGSMSFFIGGKRKAPLSDTTNITRAELDKISPNDIASVNVKKSENGTSEIIIVLKNGKIFRTYPSEIDIKNKPVSKTEGEVKITLKETDESKIFTVVDENPEFAQGQAALFKWLGENIKYPKIARDNNIQGTVFVGFIVEKDGSISNIDVKRGVKGVVLDTIYITAYNGAKGYKTIEREDHSIDNEAKRVVASMPKWKPGRQSGKPVRVAYTLPLKFKLE